jgi:hypothetical protein
MSSDGKIQTAAVFNSNIYTSTDYGVTWTPRDSVRSWRNVAMSSDGKIQTATVFSGTIYTSTDYGVTWTSRDSARSWSGVAMSSDGKIQTAVVGAFSAIGNIYTSTDYGVTWTARDSARDWITVAMSSDGKIQTATAYGPDFIYTSTDYGATWTSRDSSRSWTGVAMSSNGKIQTATDGSGFIYTSSADSYLPYGNLGIGTASPAYTLDVLAPGTGIIARFNSTNSTGCTLADGGTISCSSDEKLKKNITDLSYGLSDLMALNPVEFNWKTEDDGTVKSLGFIAQEVEKVIPKLVTTDATTGFEELNAIGLIPVLTKSIQEQQKDINLLKVLAGLTVNPDGSTKDGSVSSANPSSLLDAAKQLLAYVGIAINNGITTIKNLAVQTFSAKVARVEKLEMVDKATGDIYCMWIENGVEQKSKGACDPVLDLRSSATPTPTPTPDTFLTPTPTPTPSSDDSITPNPTPDESPTPTPTPADSPTPTPDESLSPTPTPTPTPDESPSPTPADLPTPTPDASPTATPAPADSTP